MVFISIISYNINNIGNVNRLEHFLSLNKKNFALKMMDDVSPVIQTDRLLCSLPDIFRSGVLPARIPSEKKKDFYNFTFSYFHF